jgi:hypothetical protein
MKQTERVMRHMRDFGSITPAEAINEYSIYRLASRISDLRRDGVKIKREWVKGKNKYGEVNRYAKYKLMEE